MRDTRLFHLALTHYHSNTLPIYLNFSHLWAYKRGGTYEIANMLCGAYFSIVRLSTYMLCTCCMIAPPCILNVGCMMCDLFSPVSSPFFGSDRCSMVSLPTSAKVEKKTNNLLFISLNYLCVITVLVSRSHGSRSKEPHSSVKNSRIRWW